MNAFQWETVAGFFFPPILWSPLYVQLLCSLLLIKGRGSPTQTSTALWLEYSSPTTESGDSGLGDQTAAAGHAPTPVPDEPSLQHSHVETTMPGKWMLGKTSRHETGCHNMQLGRSGLTATFIILYCVLQTLMS